MSLGQFWRRMVEDQKGGIDEKRVIGIPTFLFGVLLAVAGGIVLLVTALQGHLEANLVGPLLAISGFLTGAGLTALGLSVAGDQGVLGGPAPPAGTSSGS